MRIVDIEAYHAAVEVSADDCARLAEACTLAVEALSSDDQRRIDVACIEALGAAFRAAGLAACAQWCMSCAGCDRLREAIEQVGL